MIRRYWYSVFKTRITLPILAFNILIFIVFTTACNIPPGQSTGTQESPEKVASTQEFPNKGISTQDFSDKYARPYQMYYDSSADPALNELQVRRFIGQLHLADIEDIFGNIESLPLDDNCNYVGGPVLKDGLIWYVTVTPDLVGVNLFSIDPDGTMSSAFDLDGDRVADIVDIRLSDNRRISFVTEHFGLDVFELWLQGRDPFCETELAQQLGLPNLGCDETGDGSSGSAINSGYGIGIVNPMDLICSQYDTSPRADLMARVPNRTDERGDPIIRRYMIGDIEREVTTRIIRDPDTGAEWTERRITDTDRGVSPPQVVQIIKEEVSSDGYGIRITQKRAPDGGWDPPEPESFNVGEGNNDAVDYSEENTDPPPPDPVTYSGPTEGNPGPEGDDSNVAEFCRNRANYRSGVEQAANTDPSSMSVSCNAPVSDPDMPDDPNCIIIAWASPDDFRNARHPAPDNGCDTFQQPDDTRHCEPANIIERFRGLTAELRSLDIPEMTICPQTVCDPAVTIEKIVPVSVDMNALCPVTTETPTLEPVSATAIQNANCRYGPGTAYDIADTLFEGQAALILGRNEAKTWWQIKGPTFGTLCWVSYVTVKVNGDPDKVPIQKAPPLPEESPAAPQGCFVYDQYQNVVCTAPCPPNPQPGGACTP